ncbi:MAG: ParB/RepB/Spo0J family partition protein [Acidimicrobiales bacterium]
MVRQGGLGRGLGALIPSSMEAGTAAEPGVVVFAELSVSSIVPNQRQPRTIFDEEAMAALATSISELGVLQPILVRQLGSDSYELIAGERRWRAARRAGLDQVPAIIRRVEDSASLEQALVENVQREDLNPMDEAAAYRQLLDDFGLTHEVLAARMGRSRAAISNTLRLFQLPSSVQRLLLDGQLTAGHARAILTTPDRHYQEVLARRAVSDQLSVRALEEMARRHNRVTAEAASPTTDQPDNAAHAPGAKAQSQPRPLRPPGLLELEELLSAYLDTRVSVEMSATRGRMTIEFATLEDLERIYRVITDPTEP